MAISTYKVFLMKKGTGSAYAKLLDIKDFPDLGGTPEMLDTTTLSDRSRTGIPGIQENDALNFTANYDKTTYDALKELEGTENEYAVWFGGTEAGGTVTPTGVHGKYSFKGYLTVYANGGAVNEVVNMTLSITPTTSIVPGEATSWKDGGDAVLPLTANV